METKAVSGGVYLMARPGDNFEVLGNCVNIGTERIGATAAQRYKTDAGMTVQATQVWQKDKVIGGWIGLCWPAGGNVSIGVTKNDPRFPDIRDVQLWLNIGYVKTFVVRRK